MTDVVLFPSVLGVRPAVYAAADLLRAAGHPVHVVDLYGDGLTFDAYEPAMAHLQALGYEEVLSRARERSAGLPANSVYAGFSAGTAPAVLLAATRPGARGALLMHGALPVAELGLQTWPAGVAVQVHSMVDDPFREEEGFEGFAADVRGSGSDYEMFDYPGKGHLFADADLLDEFDADAAALMWQRAVTFLDRLGP